MRLSLVDLSVVPSNGDRHQAILNTLDMARHAERWGYSRIWLAEHHATGAMAGRAPEIMIPFIAAGTQSIRVGSGSVLLNHYSPFKVAENFAALEDMFPGRIDMGIGRATTGPMTDLALQRNRSYRQTTDDSGEQLVELMTWMNSGFDASHPFGKVRVYHNGSIPELWLLGSSPWSATAAAQLGLRYAFAGFINPSQAFEITERYRQQFRTSESAVGIETPQLILSLSVYCAGTETDAARLSAPAQLMMHRLVTTGDIRSRMEDEETAVRLLGGIPRIEPLQDPRRPPRILIGTPETLERWLREIAHAFGTEEIMIQCITPNHKGRLRSHEFLAERFGLVAPSKL